MCKMKKIKSPTCACDLNVSENIPHFLLHCVLYQNIREQYLPKYLQMNNNLTSILNSEKLILISILDPLSSKLPDSVTSNWSSVRDVYQLSRKFTYRMHLKREKLYKEIIASSRTLNRHEKRHFVKDIVLNFNCNWSCWPFLNFALVLKINYYYTLLFIPSVLWLRISCCISKFRLC